MEKCDVLIIGAGPTGLMMAIELARYGVSYKIIEKRQGRSLHSKALVIQPRTLEIFQILGIESPFLEMGRKVTHALPSTRSGPIAKINFSPLSSPFPFILSLPQSKTEEFLENHLTNLGGRVEWQNELLSLEEKGERIIAIIKDRDGTKREVEAGSVIGCDGAHSFVRRYLHLPFSGKALAPIFSIADVEMHSKKCPSNGFFISFDPEGLIAVVPLPKEDRYRLIFLLKRCQHLPLDRCPSPTLEEAKERVFRLIDPNAQVFHADWLTHFQVNSRLVAKYKMGAIYLAGDAAHIHSPIGGQGMNTGIQDAFNLGWKLALVYKGEVAPQILETYHGERYAQARRLLAGTEVATYGATLSYRPAVWIRNLLLQIGMKFPVIEKRLVGVISQTTIQYLGSRFIKEQGGSSLAPAAGMRMGNMEVCKEGVKTDLWALMHDPKTFFLFLFPMKREESKMASLIEEVKRLKLPIKVHIFQEGELYADPLRLTGGVYFVRPDGYVAYRSGSIRQNNLLRYLQIFVPKR